MNGFSLCVQELSCTNIKLQRICSWCEQERDYCFLQQADVETFYTIHCRIPYRKFAGFYVLKKLCYLVVAFDGFYGI